MTEKKISEYFEFLREYGFIYASDEEMSLVKEPSEILNYSRTHNIDLGIIYKSKYHIFVVDLVRDSDGILRTYERVVKAQRGNSVVIVAMYKEKYVLLRQFRHAMGDYQLAFPRGFGEPEISIEENTAKEIAEELNATAYDIEVIGTVIADSGLCGEKVNIVSCKIDMPYIENGYEGIADCLLVSAEELKSFIASGSINDGFTLSAYSRISCIENTLR